MLPLKGVPPWPRAACGAPARNLSSGAHRCADEGVAAAAGRERAAGAVMTAGRTKSRGLALREDGCSTRHEVPPPAEVANAAEVALEEGVSTCGVSGGEKPTSHRAASV